jgi:hypothetical protein
MDDTEILSPPYPRDTATLPRVLTCLGQLRAWLLEHRFWANESYAAMGGEGDLLPVPEHIPVIPDLTRYQAISVMDIFQTYMRMRHLRKEWNDMVDNYEETWHDKTAVQWRLRMLYTGFAILCEAFVDPETREARNDTAARQMQKTTMGILKRLGVPKELRKYGMFGGAPGGFTLDMGIGMKEDKIDFDALFHGESPDDDEPEAAEEPDDEDGTEFSS